MKRGRERAMARKPGSTFMTAMAGNGKLSIMNMKNSGRDRMSNPSSEGIWSTEEQTEHVEDDNVALNPIFILHF